MSIFCFEYLFGYLLFFLVESRIRNCRANCCPAPSVGGFSSQISPVMKQKW